MLPDFLAQVVGGCQMQVLVAKESFPSHQRADKAHSETHRAYSDALHDHSGAHRGVAPATIVSMKVRVAAEQMQLLTHV